METLYLKVPWDKAQPVSRIETMTYAHHVVIKICLGKQVIELSGPHHLFGPIADVLARRTVAEAQPAVDIGPEPPPLQAQQAINFGDLNGEPEHDIPLICNRFPWLADCFPPELRRMPEAVSENLAADLERLAPYAAELLDASGYPVHGSQTRVKEILEYAQTGGAYGRRIRARLAALPAYLEQRRAA